MKRAASLAVAMIGVMVLLLIGGASEAQIKQKTQPKLPGKQLPKQPGKGIKGMPIFPPDIEALLDNSANANPDIAVAEATRQLAKAELNLVRQQVGVKVAAVYVEWDIAKAALADAQNKANSLKNANDAAQELATAQQALASAKDELTRVQADLTNAMGGAKKPGAGSALPTNFKDAVEKAGKQHPDIMSAQAKLTAADSTVTQLRKDVMAKLAANRAARDNAEALLKEAQSKLSNLQQQSITGNATQGDLQAATVTVRDCKIEINRLQIEQAYLTGAAMVVSEVMKSESTPKPTNPFAK